MPGIGVREIPASVGQRLLWFLDHHRGADGALSCPLLCRVRGPLDAAALHAAIEDLTHRHESLRTTVERRGRQLTQVIHEPRPLPLAHIDLSGAADLGAAVRLAVTNELRVPIDAATWPVRATLFRAGGEDHLLCVNMHHLVTDAWSCGVLFEELCLLVDRRLGRGAGPPEVGWQYAQFVEWQQLQLQGGAFRAHQDYWRRQLNGAKFPALPFAARPAEGTGRRTASETVEVGREAVAPLLQLARGQRTTLFNVLLSVCCTLLHRLTGQTDLAMASLFANRPRAELQRTVGFLANTVVLRTHFPEAITFAGLLRQTHTTVMEAFVHQALPFHVLPADTVPASVQRADDVVFQMVAEPRSRARMGEAAAEMLVPDGIGSRFEFELALVPSGGRLRMVLVYNRERLEPAWAREFLSAYARLASAVATAPEAPVARISL